MKLEDAGSAVAVSAVRPLWRWLGYGALAVVLGLALWGYTQPEFVLNWDTLMALCGF